jgi:hypothetical protein
VTDSLRQCIAPDMPEYVSTACQTARTCGLAHTQGMAGSG